MSHFPKNISTAIKTTLSSSEVGFTEKKFIDLWLYRKLSHLITNNKLLNLRERLFWHESKNKQIDAVHRVKQKAKDGSSDSWPAKLLHLPQCPRPKKLCWMPSTTAFHLQRAGYQLGLLISEMRGRDVQI